MQNIEKIYNDTHLNLINENQLKIIINNICDEIETIMFDINKDYAYTYDMAKKYQNGLLGVCDLSRAIYYGLFNKYKFQDKY